MNRNEFKKVDFFWVCFYIDKCACENEKMCDGDQRWYNRGNKEQLMELINYLFLYKLFF